MKIKSAFSQTVPHILAVIIFLLLTVLFYFPLIFQNKALNQNDINQGLAAGKEIADYRDATGDEALWTNSMFGGMPAYLINIRWSGSEVLNKIEKIISFGLPTSARETFLSLICFYILLLAFGVRPSLAIAGAIAYGFSTFFIISIEAGHIWKVRAIAYAPLVVAGVHLTYLRKYWLGLGLTALALALEINSNHVQITYYLALILLIYATVQFITSLLAKEFKPFLTASVTLIFAAALAVGANLGKLWSAYEYGAYSIRGESELTSATSAKSTGLDRDYAFNWSSGKAETFTFLVPHFYGGASGGYRGENSELEKALKQSNLPPDQIQQYTRGLLGYWGTQPFVSGPVYAGAIVCFLFVVGILFAERKYVWWLVIATILSVLLSWGKNFEAFNYFMFDHFPMYNKFRAVSMTVVMAMLTMPLLGFLGLEKLLTVKWNKEVAKKIWVALGSTAGLALLIAIVAYVPDVEGDQLPDWFIQAVKSSRKSIVRADAFRSIFFIVTTFIVTYLLLKNKVSHLVFAALLILLISLDILLVNHRYVNGENYVSARKNTFLTPTPADRVILNDNTPGFRVLNLQNPFNEARTSAFHHSIGGYHGAKMRRYQDLITIHLEKEINNIISDGRLTQENTHVLNMLNTKYVLAGLAEDAVIQNPYANGAAWFIQEIKTVNSPQEEIDALSEINLKQEAVLDISNFKKPSIQYDSTSSIVLKIAKPNYLLYESNSSVNGYVVFSEIYYPKGWIAKIDNQEASIDRVNYVLRGLAVPAGTHRIEFTFNPAVYATGNTIMLICSILVVCLFAAGAGVSMRKNELK